MIASRPYWFILATLPTIAIQSGCNQKTVPPEVGSYSLSGSIGPIRLTAECGQWGRGSVFIIITDLTGTSQSGAGWHPDAAHWNGQLPGPDASNVVWDCVSADGKSGSITVAGKRYSLADGSLIFITADDAGVVVKQLKRDTLQMPPERETIELLLEDPDVRKLFGEPDQGAAEIGH